MRPTTILLAVCAACFALKGQAQTVAIADLGRLDLEYAVAQPVEVFAGPAVAAEVGYRPGEAFSVVTPQRVGQIRYLLETGSLVSAGQPIARISGPEIHHFLQAYEVTAERFALAQQRFRRNRELYLKQAIDEARWIEISDAYFELKLEHEHLRHFRELLAEEPEYTDAAVLKSPADGRLIYSQETPGVAAGGELATIVPLNSLRLRFAVPLDHREALTGLRHARCELAVASVGSVAQGYFLRVWSEPIGDCPWLPGERLMVTPLYRIPGYAVPREALLHWQGSPALLRRAEGELEVVPVEVIGSSSDGYHVRSTVDLDGREILATSVSAVQGILLGLGDD